MGKHVIGCDGIFYKEWGFIKVIKKVKIGEMGVDGVWFWGL